MFETVVNPRKDQNWAIIGNILPFRPLLGYNRQHITFYKLSLSAPLQFLFLYSLFLYLTGERNNPIITISLKSVKYYFSYKTD